MVRGLKFWIKIEEGLYYQCSENKCADQLRGYREADLRLCSCICKKSVFSRRGSNMKTIIVFKPGKRMPARLKYNIMRTCLCDNNPITTHYHKVNLGEQGFMFVFYFGSKT